MYDPKLIDSAMIHTQSMDTLIARLSDSIEDEEPTGKIEFLLESIDFELTQLIKLFKLNL
jgi:hypothetical protein